ncbi:TfoX/Sxy family protein [Croceitalea sp. MTPC9]|uniref:TfoX/Sxy family DNA transformation protein n=1 Tax=unclassified Croceitalea TaxID=2632280 RepID=UPI002B3B7D83|nr:TfoX/Sxy family protein [Croceitalea sp. MTPC6]GMN16381.1 TfoX/Sxy family protein [Croceitalea sp. MTPC9]
MKARNIGITTKKRLEEIGVHTLADLAEITPKNAYRKICERYPDKTVPKCYYLYSLKGALLNMDWRELPKEVKSELIADYNGL